MLDGFQTSCTFDYLSRDLRSRMLVLSMFLGGFVFPLVILITFFFLTKRTLESDTEQLDGQLCKAYTRSRTFSKAPAQRNQRSPLESFKLKCCTNNVDDNESIGQEKSGELDMFIFDFKKRQNRVLRTIFFHITFFTISWAPYAIIAILAQYGTDIHRYVTPFSTAVPALFAKTSSIYNPILYTLNNKDCRKFFKKKLFFKKLFV